MKKLRFMRPRKKINVKKLLGYTFMFSIVCLSILITYAGGEDNKLWKQIFNGLSLSETSIPEDSAMSVHFLDVGKADCSYIKCGSYNILIDAADRETTNNVTEYLKRQNVKNLDLVIVTHPHRDHIGQMAEVIKNFKIEKFMTSSIPEKVTPTIFSYKSMLKALNERNVSVSKSVSGEKIVMGDMIIDVLGPVNESDNLNNNSVVVKITYKSIKFLFMGDAQKEEEKDLISSGLDLSADVIKIGHHGSLTSSTEEFLKLVKPKYSIISVKHDRNNLPKQKVIDRLHELNSKVLRTDVSGNIIFFTDGSDMMVNEERQAAG